MKLFSKYFFTRSFWHSMLYALGIVLIIFILTVSFLRIYTHHGNSYAVPDFTDMPLSDAIRLIEDRNLRYEIFDSLYFANKEPGTILEQHPVSGALVKKNRKVFLTINSTSPGEIEMPNLIGITLREARVKLSGYGLKVGKLYYRYDISVNIVLEQKLNGKILQPGDSLSKGSEIDLILGKGLANKTRMVPELIGMTVKEASLAAEDATFNIGAVIEDNSLTDAPDSLTPFVFKQKPESNPEILRPLGSTISLYVTLDSTKLPGYQAIENPDLIWDELNDEH
jgi:beta-lactam-binding protein with PASTA domain